MSDPTSGVSTEVTRDIELSRQLVEWYWQHGRRRSERPADAEDWQGNYEQFVLPTGTWLRQLYEVRDGLRTVESAAARPRPSVALWGMSQTGKSTSVSALIDANVQVSDAEPEKMDGAGGGLHWDGGLPFFFVAPYRDERKGETYPPHWFGRSLNPFTLGIDASSCLSRFVAGAQKPAPGCVLVDDPKHPVQVHLVPPADLLHALARGYDSECLGPGLNGKQQEWTPERFDRMMAEFREDHRHLARSTPDREGYERMLAVVETLKDLVFARLETYDKLRTNEADWQSRLEALLNDSLLIGNPDLADAFAARLFWNGSNEITARFIELRATYVQLTQAWGKRPVYASLPATSLLLDMSSCDRAFMAQKDPQSREGQQQERIRTLGYKVAGDRVLLGCGADYAAKLGPNAIAYSNFQGLVWELVVPINVSHLRPGPFRDLLDVADVLDFPGVGRDEKNDETRLNCNPQQFGPGKGQPFTPKAFFSDVVKRGKTASIVATYSRRLTVDSFTILQNIDKDDPKNNACDQIANGVRTWLRNMSPGFTEGTGRPPAGVSLNLGLTFWGELIQQGSADRAENFDTRRKFYNKLGVISDPDVTTVFALNYHWLRGERVSFPKPFKKGTPFYRRVTEEAEFQRMFKSDVSKRSVEAMTDDLDRHGEGRHGSGGADFLFEQMRAQVLAQDPANRSARFAPIIDRLEKSFQSLLAWRHLRKPRTDADTRTEELDAFVKRLHAAIERQRETEVRLASHALRELLNVDPESIALPAGGRADLTSAFVEKLFNEWRNRQLQRYDEWARGAAPTGPDFGRLGVRDRDDVSRFLEALVTSFERKTFTEIAQIGQRAYDTIPGRTEHRAQHLRRYLAIEMTNRLLYKVPGRKAGQAAARFRSDARRDAEPMGTATPAYAAFIGPFVGVQIAGIKQHLTPVILRPPLHGDALLDTLLADRN